MIRVLAISVLPAQAAHVKRCRRWPAAPSAATSTTISRSDLCGGLRHRGHGGGCMKATLAGGLTGTSLFAGALLATGVLAAVAWVLAAMPAQAAPKVGERISVTACPYRGVVATCLMITGADG